VTWRDWANEELASVRAANRWRQPLPFDANGIKGVLGERRVVSFSANDYLGLSAHPAVAAAAHEAIDRWGTGSTASRLLGGSRPVHHELEEALARWKGSERAVLFSTGFAANVGVLTVMAGDGCTIVSDEFNHASIIDGCRLNDVEHLEKQLAASTGRAVVVTESVFSMGGDHAPVAEIGDLCRIHGALLIVDDAHAMFGAVELPSGVDVLRVGTLSKILGALGGFVAGPTPLIELIVNRARPFIFTTAPSPPDVAAALAAVKIVQSDEGAALRARLRTLIDRVRPAHRSAIVPLIVGGEDRALALTEALLQRGIWIPAVRPPTVPEGTSRLRLVLSAAHTDEMVDDLLAALADVGVDASA
jgi:8-amino-7-oxononanoate synthase